MRGGGAGVYWARLLELGAPMVLTRTAIAGCSAEGFLPMRNVRSAARSMTSSAFVAAYPCPALHVVDIKVGAASGNLTGAAFHLAGGGNPEAFFFQGLPDCFLQEEGVLLPPQIIQHHPGGQDLGKGVGFILPRDVRG